jgi:hypothetical protein
MNYNVQKTKKSNFAVSYLRTITMGGCVFGIFFSLFSCLIVQKISHSFYLGLVVSVLCGYLFTRIKHIKSISEDNIVLYWKANDLVIPISEIKHISKNIRFTFTEDFLWILKLRNGRLGFFNFYIFPNEREYDLKDNFRSLGVPPAVPATGPPTNAPAAAPTATPIVKM